MTALLEFTNTTKRFGNQTALNGLTLSIEAGEIVGFLGPNGAGKTTALHVALGFLQATSGGGTIGGAPFGSPGSRGRLGYVPDTPAFFGGTAAQEVELTLVLQGWKGDHYRRAREVLQWMNLEPGAAARRFSRGMQQRLSLAQALAHAPDLLILDEPTSALDPPSAAHVRELLLKAKSEGKAVFLSSHQMSEVEQICDRIAFLNKGKLLRLGTVSELTEDATRQVVEIRGIRAEQLPAFARWLTPGKPDTVRWTVPTEQQRELIESGWMAGGELVSASAVVRSLDEMFLEWTGGGQAGEP